jgi:hypothetical protein
VAGEHLSGNGRRLCFAATETFAVNLTQRCSNRLPIISSPLSGLGDRLGPALGGEQLDEKNYKNFCLF